MTEDEARDRWCPFSRVIGVTREGDLAALSPTASAFNRGFTIEDQEFTPSASLCLASRCMAWRWSEPKRTVAFLEAVQKHMQGQSKPNFNTATQAVFAETGGQFARIEGGCGLAGDVQ